MEGKFWGGIGVGLEFVSKVGCRWEWKVGVEGDGGKWKVEGGRWETVEMEMEIECLFGGVQMGKGEYWIRVSIIWIDLILCGSICLGNFMENGL